MKITDGEKLIILMLSDLYEKLEIKGEIEPEFIKTAIFNDHTWSIPWRYSGIPFEKQETPEIVKEVLDILDMWSFIERSYEDLDDQEKAMVEADANPHGKNPKFPGFDGNNESEYMSTASFIVNELDRFSEFKGRYFNSHHPTLETYRRMLAVYEPIMKRQHYQSLSAKNIAAILKEITHPETR